MNDTEIHNRQLSKLWEYLEANLPRYYSRDDVLHSDILFRYLTGEEVYEKDLVWIAHEYNNDREAIKKELIRLEIKFATEAIENFYEQF